MPNGPVRATIKHIEFYLPEKVLSNADLSAEFPDWPVEKIEEKTGIVERRIAAQGECSSDLGAAAAQKLFATGVCVPSDIDFILFCTQSPDHFLPTTACTLQRRLGIPTTAGALDFNLGSSGYVYGLALAQGLIESGLSKKLLFLTAETYSKFMHPADKSVRTVFGDAGAATLLTAVENSESALGPFVFGTDGSGARDLIVPTGGMRTPRTAESAVSKPDASGNLRSEDNLFMNGGEIFAFTLREVPRLVDQLLERAGRNKDDIGLFVFHQCNKYMLDVLRKRLKIPPERFYVHLQECGNTVSCTLPIALKAAESEGRLKAGDLIMLVGFGVGYSWAGTLVRWLGCPQPLW